MTTIGKQTSSPWRWALGLGVVLALAVGVASAGRTKATGWIVYQVMSPASERGRWIMRPDGSDQTRITLLGWASRERHNGKLWGIEKREVGDHVHPDGAPHEELFLHREDDAAGEAIQITDDTSFEFSRYLLNTVAWGHGDEFVSWVGIRWGTDSSGDPCVVEAGIFRAELDYDGNGNIVGLAESPWLAAEADTYEAFISPETYVVTTVRGDHDWSPDGEQVLWGYSTGVEGPTYLHITDISDPTYNWRLTDTSGGRGVWSSQNEIAWLGGGGVSLIQPDGTGETLLYDKRGNVTLMHLYWSPDGEYLTYMSDGNKVEICTLPVDAPRPASIRITGYPGRWVPE